MMRHLALGLLPLSLLLACSSPCGELKANAEGCGWAPGRWVDERDSVCRQTRFDLGIETSQENFDAYADCVVTADCADSEAVASCSERYFPDQIDDPCTRYRLWATGCGLEPMGTEDGCGDVDETAGAVPFADWVDCITENGCPLPNDPRYDECQNIVPPEMLDILDACILVNDYAETCPPEEVTGNFLVTDSLTTCFIQAQPFTAASFYAWAECQVEVECDDTLGSAACLGLLSLIDDEQNREGCEELIAYTALECNNPLVGGGSVETCLVIFGRATPSSFGRYLECVKTYDCGDILAGYYDCREELDFF